MKLCLLCEHSFENSEDKCTKCGFQPELKCGIPLFAPELSLLNDGFDASFFKNVFEIEKAHFWFSSRKRLLQKCIATYFSNLRNFCEVGCGTGNVLSAIAAIHPEISLTGSEIYYNALKYAAIKVPSARLIQADIRRFPFDLEFDVIGIFDVLEHIEDDIVALRNYFQGT